jgi:hypothetical protein
MDILNKIDPATQQTAAGIPEVKTMGSGFVFDGTERERLRALAKRVAEIAALPVQEEKAALWTKHNDLKTSQPLVFIDPENGWNECIPAGTLQCHDPLARVWEMYFLKQIYWHENMKDDKVIESYFDVPCSYTDTGWGLEIAKEGGENHGAYKVKQAIENYERDFDKVRYPQIIIDENESETLMDLAHGLFDGILQVRRKTTWWWTLGMTWDYINLRGLEDFMCDFLLEPEWVRRMMRLLCDGIMKRLDFFEENGLLSQNTHGTYVASGGFGYTEAIADKREGVTTKDMWGFVDSQETSAVSPELYGEFVFPYHKEITERFGLNCYGCCEAFDQRWKYVKELPRLRRVSCSPWAGWENIPDLLGKNYIASVKPNPAPLAMPDMDEDVVRKEIKRALECTKGCIPEIIMKDNNTLGGNPHNATRWVEIIREEIARI